MSIGMDDNRDNLTSTRVRANGSAIETVERDRFEEMRLQRRAALNLMEDAVLAREQTEKAIAELRARERDLNALVNKAPFLLARCSSDLRYRFVSRAYANMLGFAPEELAGKSIAEILGEESMLKIQPYIDLTLSGERVQYEMGFDFPDVGHRWLDVVYNPDRDETGKIVGWIGAIVDITERKRFETELRGSEERLRLL